MSKRSAFEDACRIAVWAEGLVELVNTGKSRSAAVYAKWISNLADKLQSRLQREVPDGN